MDEPVRPMQLAKQGPNGLSELRAASALAGQTPYERLSQKPKTTVICLCQLNRQS
jgi:hypothetical protein